MRLALAIETSNPSAGCGAGVALGEITKQGVKPLDSEPVHRTKGRTDDLTPAIERLASRVGASPRDIGLVGVSVGPGGYTGLRMAVVTAQAIATVSGGACIGAPTSDVVARRAPRGRPFAVCLASKGETAYVRTYDASGAARDEGGVLTSDQILSLDVEVLAADRHLPASVREGWGGEIREPVFDPAAIFELGLPAVAPGRLAVLYPREPDAVTQWRRLHGGS